MKNNLIIPALTLVVGIGIGVAVDRTVITTGSQGEPGKGQSSASAVGPRAAMDAGLDPRGMSKAGSRTHLDRNAVATIRRVSKQLEMSPMTEMDFGSLFEAYEAVRWMEPDDIRLALGELSNQQGMNQGAMMLRFMLLGLWAKQDGKGAMEYSMSLKQPMDKMMGVTSSIAGWMKHDPGNAYQWYKDNRGELGGSMMGGMGMNIESMFIASLASQDMGTAFRELGELSGQNQSIALAMMASNVGMDDVKRQQFLKHLEKFEDGDPKKTGMDSMIRTWAMADPQGAIAHLEKMDPKPDNHKALLDSAASSWGTMDPEAAIQWQLKNVGEEEVASDKIASTFGQWAMTDSAAAEKWLSGQPEGFATDELYSAATSSEWMNPEGATKWAVKIQDENRRQAALRQIHGYMQALGENVLKKWMDGLDPEIRKEVDDMVAENMMPKEHLHETLRLPE